MKCPRQAEFGTLLPAVLNTQCSAVPCHAHCFPGVCRCPSDAYLPGLSSEAVLDQAGTELAEEGNTTLVLVLKSLASRDAGPIAPLQGTWTACERVKLMACTSLQCALGRLGA